MNNDVSSAKIRMLKGSLECFTLGLLGLLPVIGLPFAIGGLVVSRKALAGQKRYWNAARAYWILGLVCALLGTITWSIVDTILVVHAVLGSTPN
jgi:hypothetical protein